MRHRITCTACRQRRLMYSYLVDNPTTTGLGYVPRKDKRCRPCSAPLFLSLADTVGTRTIWGWHRWDYHYLPERAFA